MPGLARTHAPDAQATSTSASAAALIAGLGRTPPIQTRFAEARFSPVLDRALVVSGTLSWQGGERLRRDVDTPYAEQTVIHGQRVSVTRPGHGERHFSLDRAPALGAMLQGLVAVLAGDPARLNGHFGVRLDGDVGHGWTLTLRPQSARLAQALAHIRMDGHAHQLDCLEIVQAGGSVSIDLLGALAAAMPAQPSRAQLTALCRRAR